MSFSVPGKLVLLGEYAVLEDSPALVAAVCRRATIERSEEPQRPSPIVRAVCAQAKREDEAPHLRIDTRSFYDEGRHKLGLGSSAAVAVAVAVYLRGRADAQALSWALDGHRAAALGVGSGIDVVACFYGGVIATSKQPASVEQLPYEISGLHLGVFFTNRSASTKSLVSSCQASSAWSSLTLQMKDVAQDGIAAWRGGDVSAFLEASVGYGALMMKLGRAAGVEIVTDEMQALIKTAKNCGAACKPSGAGGGDVALVWAARATDLDEIEQKTGTKRIAVDLGAQGVLSVGT